jgi:hypothetical protein
VFSADVEASVLGEPRFPTAILAADAVFVVPPGGPADFIITDS